MLNWSSLGTLVLGGGGLVTGILALFSARANKGKVNSETNLNIASVEESREKLHQSRELFWRNEMQQVREAFEREIQELRNEVTWLRVLIESHVPWDWEVVRLLKLAGIEYRDPPTLNYLQSKIEKSEES